MNLTHLLILITTPLLRWINSTKNRNDLAVHRKDHRFKKFDELLLALHRSYQNLNFNIETNGEKRVLKFITEQNPSVVFDVGANQGNWSKLVQSLSPDTTIYAFEPIQETFDRLQKNIPEVKSFHCALGAEEGVVKFGKCGESECSSKFSDAIGGLNSFEETHVKKGDLFLAEHQIQSIDFLKIDAEGMDYEVLMGFKDALDQNKISFIQFEYSKYNIHSRVFLKDFHLLLSSKYRIGKIYPHYIDFRDYNDDLEDFIGSNFLAVRKDIPLLGL